MSGVREINEFVHRQQAIAKLRKSGLVFPKQVTVPDEFLDDDGNLIIPEDVSEIPTEELGRFLSVFTALAAYYDAVVSCADIDFTTAARVKEYIEAKTLLEMRGDSVTEKKAARDLDEVVIRAQDWHDSQDAMFKLSKALLSGVERIIFLLSREITRRGNGYDRDGRNYAVNGKPTPYSERGMGNG